MLVSTTLVVSAASDKTVVYSQSGRYTVMPASSFSIIGIKPNTVYNTITQGQTNWHSQVISSGTTLLNVNLNWGNTANSLRLRVYTADGGIYGPYYDNADGLTDGRINIGIYDPNGLAPGTWYFEVYGDSVTGTQGYYI